MKGLISEQPKRTLTAWDMLRMGVGKRFWLCTLGKMTDACEQKPKIEAWVKNVKSNLENGYGLLLMGNYNTGKTGSAVICAKATVMHGGTAYMIRGNTLNQAIFDNTLFDQDELITERVRSVDLLVLDDVGCGHESSWGLSVIEEVLRDRSDRMASTIITTNLDKNAMHEKFGESLLNFLSATMVSVVCKGQNFRDNERADVKGSIS